MVGAAFDDVGLGELWAGPSQAPPEAFAGAVARDCSDGDVDWSAADREFVLHLPDGETVLASQPRPPCWRSA